MRNAIGGGSQTNSALGNFPSGISENIVLILKEIIS